jgi:hypothetical protein
MIWNNFKRNWLSVLIIAPMLAVSCKYDKEELLYPGSTQPTDCSAIPATFNADVLPLITAHCAIPGCHDATASGGLTFQNYIQISSAKDMINTQVIVLKAMPPTGPLPSADINILKCWIEGGAINIIV